MHVATIDMEKFGHDTSTRNFVHGLENDDAVHSRNHNSMNSRQKNKMTLNSTMPKNDGIEPEDSDAMEFYTQVRSQKEEIQSLREQIANTCVRELQLRNEKYALERKFADLRMAVDERQNEAVTSALNELVRRKVDLEENLKLTHELKLVEAERYIFVSSMLSLLAEYGIWPHAINASAITYGVKRLHDQLQWKIRTSNDRIRALTIGGVNQAESESYREDNPNTGILMNRIPREEMNLGPSSNMPRNNHDVDLTDKTSLVPDGRVLQETNSPEFSFIHNRKCSENTGELFHPSGMDSTVTSSSYEEGPAIEDFQIIGNATPGEKLLGCGFPVRGTSLCMFQWIRHLEDGTRQYIEGATNPEYVVTADDVDKLIAVECIPMDDQGRQGELVKLFANEQNKITCDPEMQQEIDMYISVGEAAFSVRLLHIEPLPCLPDELSVSLLKQTDSSETWEATTLLLRRSGYQIKSKRQETVLISDKFTKDFSIKIPSGLSTQVVLTCSDGSSHPLSAANVRMRDILVLTMRSLQTTALDEKRKKRVLSRT